MEDACLSSAHLKNWLINITNTWSFPFWILKEKSTNGKKQTTLVLRERRLCPRNYSKNKHLRLREEELQGLLKKRKSWGNCFVQLDQTS